MRHVLRVRDIGRLRARAERDPAGPGFVLPHAAAERGDLAHRRDALDPALRVPLPAPHPGHELAAVHPDAGLALHGLGRVHGLRVDVGLDRALPHRNPHDPEIQTELNAKSWTDRATDSVV